MQVNAECLSSANKEYRLSNAILLYKDAQGTSVFSSVHDIETKTGVPSIKAGSPVSKSGLVEMLKALNPQDFVKPELLGDHILAKGSDHLAWFCKPHQEVIWFKCKELGEVSAKVNHPGLVFIIINGHWHVFAVKGKSRPKVSTQMYVAPYFNVWAGGRICTGNIDIPKGAKKFDTSAWEDAFMRTFFTHPNVHEKGKLTTYRGGPFALWRALMKGREFPTESLVPTGQTLAEVFERMLHGPA